MQPTQYPVNFHELFACWRQFVEQGILAAQLDPLIVRSWRRCLPKHNPYMDGALPCLSDEALQTLRVQQFDLIAIARPFMEDIYQCVEQSGYLVLLLDATGCILDALGDSHVSEQLANLGLLPGVYWGEEQAGSNAFGLALLERSAVQVVGAEHLFLRFHALTAAAAPIFNAQGHPIGVIGMAGLVRSSDVHTLAIVHSAARAIESQRQNEQLFKDLNLQRTQLTTILEAISDGLVVCDVGGIITHLNSEAAQLLNIKPETVVGRPLSEYVDLPELVQQARRTQQALTDVEVTFQVKGLQVGCLVSLYAIGHEDNQEAQGFILTLRRIEQVHRLVQRMVGARSPIFTLNDFVGESTLANQVRRQAQTAARSRSPVLIQGEAGTGKGVVARAIHNESARADGPFVSVNCRALPRDLVVGEFLGFEAGVLRGPQGQPSKFELAHGGTLHLEEADALPLEMQGALLRVIDTGEVMRLGGSHVIPVDVRFIVSATSDLERHVINGEFRADLFYALSRISLRLPALRDRMADLPLIVNATLDRLRRQSGRRVEVSAETLQMMRRYRWPGNVRELENALERAAVLADSGTIEVRHLPESIKGRGWPGEPIEYVPAMHEAEYEAILRAASACQGNLTKMAEMLGIGRTTLWRKIKASNIRVEDFRRPVGTRK
ncbi:PTS-dependent dihydroxyacetone kinase operon regulatory protein [Thermoflexales bacterium]|nr:PTS-dependent dihydroxyacetone kinase operon regulatory protein [Thermoflexales bacterium]